MNILHKVACAFLSMPWAYCYTSNWFDLHVCFCEYFTGSSMYYMEAKLQYCLDKRLSTI